MTATNTAVNMCIGDMCSEFLAQGAREPVNVDGRVADVVRTKVENNPSRWCFGEAEVCRRFHAREQQAMPCSTA